MLVLAVAGWLYDRSTRNAEFNTLLKNRADAKENIGFALATLRAYNSLEVDSPDRLNEKRRIQLLDTIWLLSQTESLGNANDNELHLRLTKGSLDLLNCSKLEDLRLLVANAAYYGLPEPFIDPDNQHYEELAAFVEKAFKWPPD